MFPCEIEERPTYHTVSIRFRSPVGQLAQHFGEVYGKVIRHVEAVGGVPLPLAYAAYHNMDMQNLDVEAGFPVANPIAGAGEVVASTIPGGLAAVCHYTGPYEAMSPAYDQLQKFIAEQGYRQSHPVYEWYLNGPEDTTPDGLRTDIVIPVIRVGEPEPR